MSDFCARYGKYREMVNFLRKYLGDFLIASYLDVIQESGYDAVYVKEIEVTFFFSLLMLICSFPMVNSLVCLSIKFAVQMCHYPNVCIFLLKNRGKECPHSSGIWSSSKSAKLDVWFMPPV